MSLADAVRRRLLGGELATGSSLFAHAMEMERYVDELSDPRLKRPRDEAIEKLGWVDGTTGTLSDTAAERLYAVVRKFQPDTIVETGCCNGWGTLHLLLALAENDHGSLTTIDCPFRADEDLSEFRSETYESFGGAQIPADKDPGWIVPDELRDRWTLIEGKSQVELPAVLADSDGVDLFIHDSEHTALCMAMEIDLAWHHLNGGGLLVVDDVSWSDAWAKFRAERDPALTGWLADDVAFAVKEVEA